MHIKRQYLNFLEKLLIFPGDWHLLKNVQEVLMKEYFHSGLKEIAKEAGYKSSTLNSLESCLNFKRTHCFLLQVWEAIYRYIISLYEIDQTSATCSEEDLHPNVYVSLGKFIKRRSEDNNLLLYWSRFVMEDCLAYIQLYLAIRSSNWYLDHCFSRLIKTFTKN